MDALPYREIRLQETPKDWRATAQRISEMNLIISVDTAVVHLAGAMGVPCWVPLHCRPYFIYPITREDCPWYPSVKLYKQKKEHEWKPVFDRIANDLKEYASSVQCAAHSHP
jgi:ADP-heptose:LPS heptosyltransferase